MIRKSATGFVLSLAVLGLAACGGAADEQTPDAAAPAETPSQPTPPTQETTEATPARDDTADAAMETYLNGIRDGRLDIAISVLHPDEPGTTALIDVKEGWDRAAADGAPVAMAQAALAGDIDSLSYEKISDDGTFATFRFTRPARDEPWEIEAVRTPEGWRIRPPASGLPTG